MTEASPRWLNDEPWLELLGSMFMEDMTLADRAAEMWYYLLQEIETGGPEGITRVRQCLENAIRLTFEFSSTHKVCRTLFQLSLGASLRTEDQPLNVLLAAIERVERSKHGEDND